LSNFNEEREEKKKRHGDHEQSQFVIVRHFWVHFDRWIPDSPTRYQGSAAKDRFSLREGGHRLTPQQKNESGEPEIF